MSRPGVPALPRPPARPPRSGHGPPWAASEPPETAPASGRAAAPAAQGIASAGGRERGTAARPGRTGRAREPTAAGSEGVSKPAPQRPPRPLRRLTGGEAPRPPPTWRRRLRTLPFPPLRSLGAGGPRCRSAAATGEGG